MKEFEPLPSADAAWPSGLPADQPPLAALSRSAHWSVGGAIGGWIPFLASTMQKQGKNAYLCSPSAVLTDVLNDIMC